MATAAQTASVLTWAQFQESETWKRLSPKRQVWLAAYLANGGDLIAASRVAFTCRSDRHAQIMGHEALRSRAIVAALRLWRGQTRSERELFIEELEHAVAKSKPGSVAHHRGLALLARVKFGVGISEPEEPNTTAQTAEKFSVGDVVHQKGQKYRITSVDADGKPLTADEVE